MNSIYKFDIDSCGICYESYAENPVNECLLLKCQHIFHETCINEWMKKQSNCPMCQEKIYKPLSIKDIKREGCKYVFKCIKIITWTYYIGLLTHCGLKYYSPQTLSHINKILYRQKNIEHNSSYRASVEPEHISFINSSIPILAISLTIILFMTTQSVKKLTLAQKVKKINYTYSKQN